MNNNQRGGVFFSPFNNQYVASPRIFCLCFHMKLGLTFPSLSPLLCYKTKLFFMMPSLVHAHTICHKFVSK